MTWLRWLQASYGTVLIVAPARTIGVLAQGPVGGTTRTVVRVLGLRETGQALVCAPRPTGAVLRAGAGVDALHAATMLALATCSPTWRRPALASAAVAGAFAFLTLSEVGRAPRPAGGSLRAVGGTHPGPLDRLLDVRDRAATTAVGVVADTVTWAKRGDGR